ncbi:hypothetical protein BKA66DRAFT_270058 [Pyrenochaeta sp. MPI-SDFR-AT-0127]|nr:hypothetical protein BKA66DRAFT_270058 [Pyrenochaeta sp. MPI-SDFR-AT-0127]
MRSFNFVLTLLFAFLATSYAWPTTDFAVLEVRRNRGGNDTNSNGNPTKKACRQLAKLTKLTELAANQTKLDELVAKGKMNATDVEELKTEAADATTRLQTLSANTTLTSECAVINAEKETVGQCKQMNKLQKLADLAGNQTAMDAFVQRKGLNETNVEKLQEKIQQAETKLQEMQSNTTLTDFCTQRKQQKDQENGDDTTSSTESNESAETPQQVASNSAIGLTPQSMPYVFVTALGAAFAFLL